MSEDLAAGPVLKASHLWAILGSRLGASGERDEDGIDDASTAAGGTAVTWIDGGLLAHAPAIRTSTMRQDTRHWIIGTSQFDA
jgi:hypothetical protein